MIEILGNMPDNVVAMAAHGKVTDEDYDRVLVPAIEDKLRDHKKIGCLYQLDQDFLGFSGRTVWDDFRFGMQHFTDFRKIAVVTDVDWIRDAVRMFGLFIPCPVQVFGNEEALRAKFWVSGYE